jgi:hypothetical protein
VIIENNSKKQQIIFSGSDARFCLFAKHKKMVFAAEEHVKK